MRWTVAIALSLSLVLVAWSAPVSGPAPGAADRAFPGRSDADGVEVRLTDGGVLKLKLRETRLEIKTCYGSLSVPLAAVRRIELAPRLPREVARRVEAAIADLGSGKADRRDAAAAELVKLREKAYPALVRASKEHDSPAADRAGALVKKLRQLVPAEHQDAGVYDVIHTADAKITGWIETESWKAHTWQFGDVRLRLADVRRLRSLAVPDVDDTKADPDPGSLTSFNNQMGKTFRFRVTGSVTGSVWGTDLYTTDSTLAAAAVHAGVLRPGQTGVVRVTIVQPPPGFMGSTRNGVTSSPWGAFPAAYRVSR